MLDPLKTSSYDYNLPKNQIATYPVTPADSAKLLVFNRSTNTIIHSTFKDILEFLPNDLSIFLNDTKVIKARIFGVKDSGGQIELLLNKPLFMDRYLVMIRGKVRVGTKLLFDENLSAIVEEVNEDGSRIVEFLKKRGFIIIDCQVHTKHLESLGGEPIPREQFLKIIKKGFQYETLKYQWENC